MTNEAELGAAIGEVMGQVLVREPLAADEDFFDCGGDSLRAVEVLQRLVDDQPAALGEAPDGLHTVLLEAIFEDATPAGLATVIAGHGARPAGSSR